MRLTIRSGNREGALKHIRKCAEAGTIYNGKNHNPNREAYVLVEVFGDEELAADLQAVLMEEELRRRCKSGGKQIEYHIRYYAECPVRDNSI